VRKQYVSISEALAFLNVLGRVFFTSIKIGFAL
jgi:hypothetical protein